MRDARAALDALREEERERRRREAEEAERIRQIQMREKLEVMRQKKQEYLQYQRQVLVLKYPGVFPPGDNVWRDMSGQSRALQDFLGSQNQGCLVRMSRHGKK